MTKVLKEKSEEKIPVKYYSFEDLCNEPLVGVIDTSSGDKAIKLDDDQSEKILWGGFIKRIEEEAVFIWRHHTISDFEEYKSSLEYYVFDSAKELFMWMAE